MDKTIITTRELNPNHYMEIGIDDNHAVLYVYKDGDLLDWHFFGASLEQEMRYLVDCFKTTHGTEPSIDLIVRFRLWCKELKRRKIIQ